MLRVKKIVYAFGVEDGSPTFGNSENMLFVDQIKPRVLELSIKRDQNHLSIALAAKKNTFQYRVV